MKGVRFTLLVALVVALLPQVPRHSAVASDIERDTVFALNGSAQYGYAGNSTALRTFNAITIEVWIRPNGNCTGNIIAKEFDYALYCSSGQISYALASSSTSWVGVQTGISIPAGQWHHVAISRAASTNVVNFYLDGQLTYTGTADAAGTSALKSSMNTFLNIGARGQSTTYFNGSIDEVRIFNVSRTGAQIASDMHTWGPLGLSSVVGYYDFNSVTGSTIENKANNADANSNLTVNGSPTYESLEDTSQDSGQTIVAFKRSYLSSDGGWMVPLGVSQVDALIIGGGGSGGAGIGGGGGAGEMIYKSSYPLFGVVTVTVGPGGTSATNRAGGNGGNSVLDTVTAYGGGGGGSGTAGTQFAASGGAIGSGGGGYFGVSGTTKSSGGGGSTNNGGAGSSGGCSEATAGGGGGAGGAGFAGTTSNGGNGGAGLANAITGVTVTYAGGGGGGLNGTSPCITTGNSGTGGSGGGGAGGLKNPSSTDGFAGSANTGSGGGGASNQYSGVNGVGGNGGSGIVIIRYTPDVTGPAISSATVTSNGSSLELLFNETLSTTTAPANSFTVSRTLFAGSSDTITVSSLSASGSGVTLNLAGTVFAGDTVTVSYVDPSGSDDTNALQDLTGNDVSSFSSQPVTNNSTVKQSQSTLTITSTTVAYGDDLTLTTSGGSGTGTLTFDVDTGNCIIQGSTLFSSSVGSCTVTATKAADTNYLAESATAVITITSGSATLTIAFSSTTFTFGVTNPITVTVSAAGTVRFSANGRVIKNCKAISTIPNLGIASGGMTYRATCNYRPGTRGPLKITARLTPTDLNIAPRSSTSAQFVVLRRTGVRG